MRLNRDLLAVYTAEALVNLFAEGAIDFDKVLGAEHAIHLIEELISERQNELGQLVFMGDIREYVYSVAEHILNNLPEKVNKLIDSLMFEGELTIGIKERPNDRTMGRFVRTVITSYAKQDAAEVIRQLGLKEDARGGSEAEYDLSQLSEHFGHVYLAVKDAKKIFRSNRTDKRWREFVSAAHPALYPDLIERLNPNAALSDELLAKLAEKGGTSAPADLALEYAARLCGVPAYYYTIRHLKNVLSQQGMTVKKLKAKRGN
jgi:hypothetical protein